MVSMASNSVMFTLQRLMLGAPLLHFMLVSVFDFHNDHEPKIDFLFYLITFYEVFGAKVVNFFHLYRSLSGWGGCIQ